jgi:hypothetical protein
MGERARRKRAPNRGTRFLKTDEGGHNLRLPTKADTGNARPTMLSRAFQTAAVDRLAAYQIRTRCSGGT